MEKVEGPTMLTDVSNHPARALEHLRTLAELQRRLHELPVPDGLDRPWPDEPAACLHRDFHPDNIILSPNGPVVIDWTNAMAGPPALDVGMTHAILLASEVPGSRLEKIVVGLGRRLMVRTYLRAYGDVDDRDRWLAEACEQRLADRNLLASERPKVTALARKARAGAGD